MVLKWIVFQVFFVIRLCSDDYEKSLSVKSDLKHLSKNILSPKSCEKWLSPCFDIYLCTENKEEKSLSPKGEKKNYLKIRSLSDLNQI